MLLFCQRFRIVGICAITLFVLFCILFVCHLMDIEVLDSIAPTRVDDGLVDLVGDGEVVDGVVQGGWGGVLWEGRCQAGRGRGRCGGWAKGGCHW